MVSRFRSTRASVSSFSVLVLVVVVSILVVPVVQLLVAPTMWIQLPQQLAGIAARTPHVCSVLPRVVSVSAWVAAPPILQTHPMESVRRRRSNAALWKAPTVSHWDSAGRMVSYSTTDPNAAEPLNTKPSITNETILTADSDGAVVPPNDRAVLLNRCLDAVLHPTSSNNNTGPPPSQDLMEAALTSLLDPSKGYDPNYGRPALRTYRSFVFPKPSSVQPSSGIQLEAAAKRTANQIDFLVKRQASQRAEAVRNHDDNDDNTSTIKRFPITLVLDNLRGSFNVGSIFRTAEACGVSEILTCGITPHPFGSGAEKVAKSALGADVLVPTRHFGTTVEALSVLKQNGDDDDSKEPPPLVVALETTAASVLYTGFDYRPYYDDDSGTHHRCKGIALVLGNEVTGVDVELLAPLLDKNEHNRDNDATEPTTGLVDLIVELPTHGKKNSLNVAAVAPVVLYEILRQWETKPTPTTE